MTDRIRKLADEVTMNAHTPREQAKALYEWVATTIEYAEHGVGDGFVVPHEADLVLANRMETARITRLFSKPCSRPKALPVPPS